MILRLASGLFSTAPGFGTNQAHRRCLLGVGVDPVVMPAADSFPELDLVEHAAATAAHVVDVAGVGLAPRELAVRVDPEEPDAELPVHHPGLAAFKGRFGGFSHRRLGSLRP